jgi:hypothetical protein
MHGSDVSSMSDAGLMLMSDLGKLPTSVVRSTESSKSGWVAQVQPIVVPRL